MVLNMKICATLVNYVCSAGFRILPVFLLVGGVPKQGFRFSRYPWVAPHNPRVLGDCVSANK
jgi:hypothetical protein